LSAAVASCLAFISSLNNSSWDFFSFFLVLGFSEALALNFASSSSARALAALNAFV
jgi:hypothetical protein